MRPAVVILAPLPKRLVGLKSAFYMSVHEVHVRMSLGKIGPWGRLQVIL
jgi:hypothetical protein